MKIRVAAASLLTLCAAFLVDAAAGGTSPPATVASRVAAEPTRGPGLGNLAYSEAELFQPISLIRTETAAGKGDGDMPFRYPGRKAYGINVGLMLNGYFVVMFAPDSGQSTGGFLVYDVSDPRKPRLVKKIHEPTGRTAEFREPHAIGQATIAGRQYLVVPSTRGIEFWDFTDVNDIRQVKKLALPSVNGGDYSRVTWQLWWQAPYVYVASADDGMYIVDARDPAHAALARRGNGRPNPVPTGELGGFRVGPIFTMGNHLVLSSMEASSGLASLDISDPLNPRLLDSIGDLPFYYATCFDGRNLYGSVRGRGARMFSYDLADPARFVARDNRLAMDDQLYCGAQDHFVFQGAQEMVHKVDVSDPLNHRHVGTGGLFPAGSDAARHSDHGQVTPMGNLLFIGNDHGTASGFIVHDRSPDRTPPQVRQVSPRPGAVKQATTSRIGIALSDNILPESIHAASFIVRPRGGKALAGTYSVQLGIVNFAPAKPLAPNTSYEVVVPAGGLRDYAGNPIATTFKAQFTTGDRSPRADLDDDIASLPGLVHHWPLENTTQDIIGGNDGTPTPNDRFGRGGLDFGTRSAGVMLARPDTAAVLAGSASLSFHIRTTQRGSANAWQAPGIFGREHTSGSSGMFWGWIDHHGRLGLSFGDPSPKNPGVRSTRAINDGQWHFVVLTRDAVSGAQTVVVDGVRASGSGPAGVPGTAAKRLMLGQIQGSADFFRGSLANVRVYDRILADAEIAALHRPGSRGDAPRRHPGRLPSHRVGAPRRQVQLELRRPDPAHPVLADAAGFAQLRGGGPLHRGPDGARSQWRGVDLRVPPQRHPPAHREGAHAQQQHRRQRDAHLQRQPGQRDRRGHRCRHAGEGLGDARRQRAAHAGCRAGRARLGHGAGRRQARRAECPRRQPLHQRVAPLRQRTAWRRIHAGPADRPGHARGPLHLDQLRPGERGEARIDLPVG
jgi:hypothetical protein